MERYTKRLEDGQAVMDCANCPESWNTNPDCKCTSLYCRNRLKDRLAAYEDTGLEPEEIKNAYQEGWKRAIDTIAYEEQAGTILVENPLLAEYVKLGPLDRLRELAQADREGKIPKHTIGDTIYDRFNYAWEVTAVERHLLAGEPKWIYRCGHIGTNDYCALWEFEVLTHAEAQAALRREQDG